MFHKRRMLSPIQRGVAKILRGGSCVRNASVQVFRRIHDMKNYLEMILMKLFDHLLRIGKYVFVKLERTMPRVPTRRTKSRSQVNHRVAGQPLVAERFGLF